MNERDYHDHHYEADAAAIQGTPIFRRVHDRNARDFLRAAGAGPRHRILSLGCGDGSIERRLAPHVGEIVGLDVSSVADVPAPLVKGAVPKSGAAAYVCHGATCLPPMASIEAVVAELDRS